MSVTGRKFENYYRPPTSKAILSVKMEYAECRQRGRNASDAQGRPEEAKSNWQFTTGVEV
jgi:hypothetical protein